MPTTDTRENGDGASAASELTVGATHGASQPGSADEMPLRGNLVGRYVVLNRLGSGGMGVVFAAYDPELDRKIALKLLHSTARDRAEDRARLLREAQAMAKLAHPNIVAVHDVGTVGEQVWIAMEFVDGCTLGTWLRERVRTWREVMDVSADAGRGLATAHAAGLVHRDFKPDNVMVGLDGRVRVMDFGLARAELAASADESAFATARAVIGGLTQAGSLVGTPAYMSPEQHAGATTDPRSDQFSFCVTLWEGLYGQRPFGGGSLAELAANVMDGNLREPPPDRRVPRWLCDVVKRGLSREPTRRWLSMEHLLAALHGAQSRARRRRWGLVAGALAFATLGLTGARRLAVERRRDACEREGASIEAVWNDETRDAVRAAMLATKTSYAESAWEKTRPWLDAQAGAWRETRSRACMAATVDEIWDASMLERSTWCLDDRRMELESLVDELGRADAGVVHRAAEAAAGLTPIKGCADPSVLERLGVPAQGPESLRETRIALSRASALEEAGRYDEGLAIVEDALEGVDDLGWPPLAAAVRARQGSLLDRVGAYERSERASEQAFFDAARAGAWEVAASAATNLAFLVGYVQARHADGIRWSAHAQVALSHAVDPGSLDEAGRLGSLGAIYMSAGDYDQARTIFEQVAEIMEASLGPEHPTVARAISNLANVELSRGNFVTARDLNERALAMKRAALGAEHPDVAASLTNLASTHNKLGNHEESERLLEQALAISEEVLGPDHPDVASAYANLAVALEHRGRHAEARALYERAVSIQERTLGPDHPALSVSLGNLATAIDAAGDHVEALRLHERALSMREKALGPDHPDVAVALYNVGVIRLELGEREAARPHLARALAIREKALGPNHPDVARTLARVAKLDLDGGAARIALPMLERSVAIYDALDGEQDVEADVRFWLAEALVATDGDRDRAIAQARTARELQVRAGEPARARVEQIDAWLRRVE